MSANSVRGNSDAGSGHDRQWYLSREDGLRSPAYCRWARQDAKDLLPKEKADVVNAALATAESSSAIAQAEVAKALGYELCKCSYPPTIMLTVGQHNGRGQGVGPVSECPRCGFNTAGPFMYNRTAPERGPSTGGATTL